MSFTNIQDDGIWKQGGTYTFDWIPEFTEVINGGTHDSGYQLLTDGLTYWNGVGTGTPPADIAVVGTTALNEILFTTDSEVSPSPDPGAPINDLVDASQAVVTNIEDVNLDGSLYRYTVQLSADIPTGTYYLKAADYDYTIAPG